jgi:hypothetical protein
MGGRVNHENALFLFQYLGKFPESPPAEESSQPNPNTTETLSSGEESSYESSSPILEGTVPVEEPTERMEMTTEQTTATTPTEEENVPEPMKE